MKRRDFLTKSALAALLAAGTLTFGDITKLLAQNNIDDKKHLLSDEWDLVAVKNGEPDKMFDKAIEALGGMKNFVKKGQTVIVKPNIGWDVIPELAANTNPLLVKRVIEHCYNAGAKEVYVFDNTCDDWTKCYKNSGIEQAVKDAKGKIVPGNDEKYFQAVEVKKGKKLTKTTVHEKILECDVFINLPILKSHSSANLTISMKNLMGIVYDRGFWHKNNLHQCIADFASYRKPDLNIVDAYNVMKSNGPRGKSKADVVSLKSLIISKDMVAADTAAAAYLNLKPGDVEYIKLAHALGIGRSDLENLKIKKIKL